MNSDVKNVSTINNYFVNGIEIKEKGIELKIKEPKQFIRGFGGCFNELGKKAIDTLSLKRQKEVKVHSGVPCSDESYREWKKAFIDIDESIQGLDDDN